MLSDLNAMIRLPEDIIIIIIIIIIRHDTAWLLISETGDRLRRVKCLEKGNHHLGQLSLASLRGVAKSSTSFGWGKGGKVTAAG